MKRRSRRKRSRARSTWKSSPLKKLGLVPPEFDLAKATVDLMTEQAAAFYDYRKKKLFLLEASAGANDQGTVLAHELSHALADQHFNLNKYLHRGKTDDSARPHGGDGGSGHVADV